MKETFMVVCDNCGDYSYHFSDDGKDWGVCSTCEIGFPMRRATPEEESTDEIVKEVR